MVPFTLDGLRQPLGLLAFVTATLSPPLAGRPEAPAEGQAVVEADRLHREAGQPEGAVSSLRSELSLLDRALAESPVSYPLLWRAARAESELATHLAGKERKQAFEHAIVLGRRAVAACGECVEGHYWLGASYGRAAEAQGGLRAFFLARRLRGEMEAVLRLQPAYEDGDAFLALGELDRGLPGFLGGDAARALRTLEQGLRVAPDNAELKLALAEAYLDARHRDQARELLEELVAPAGAGRRPSEDVVRRARELLATLGPREASPAAEGPSAPRR